MMDLSMEKDFIRCVDELSSGERAALRRAAGCTLRQADGGALTAFYRVLPRTVPQRREDAWFLGACLRCLWKPDEMMNRTLEQAMTVERQKTDSTAYEKRLVILLDTPMDEDGYFAVKLWRLTKLLKHKNHVVDCAALISDLCFWNDPARRVQKRWARTFGMLGISDQEEQLEAHMEGE